MRSLLRGNDVLLDRFFGLFAEQMYHHAHAHMQAVWPDELTERAEQSEAALRIRESQLRQIADSMPQMIWTARPDGTIDYYNERWYEYTGLPPDEIGPPNWEPILHSDDVERSLDTYFGCIRDGTPYEIEFRFKDRHRGGYRWFMCRALPIYNEAGEIVRWFGTLTDIDDIKHAEQANALLAVIVESSDDAIISMTLDGIITSWNRSAEKMFDYTVAEAVGQNISLIVPAERRSEETEVLERLRRGEKVDHFETVRQAKNGGRINISLTVSPIKDAAGRIIGASKVARDITEHGRLERQTQQQAAELVDLHRRKDEFLAMLSHELRNPLSAIWASVQLLGLHRGNETRVQQQARSIIERQLGHVRHLVDDLLEVSRITTGRIQLRREPIAVSAIVDFAIEAVRPLLEQRRHDLTVLVPPEPIFLYADAARLDQVVMNLLTNAAKYTEDGGHVWLTVEKESNECVIRVRDTGVGIAPELLPRIFDLFTQAERSLDRSQGGLGIGLALVHRLTELHGGRGCVPGRRRRVPSIEDGPKRRFRKLPRFSLWVAR